MSTGLIKDDSNKKNLVIIQGVTTQFGGQAGKQVSEAASIKIESRFFLSRIEVTF